MAPIFIFRPIQSSALSNLGASRFLCVCGFRTCSRYHVAMAEAARIKLMRRTACAIGTRPFHLRPWISVSTAVASPGSIHALKYRARRKRYASLYTLIPTLPARWLFVKWIWSCLSSAFPHIIFLSLLLLRTILMHIESSSS